MGPVSFQRIGDGEDRDELMAQARLLRAAGIRVQSVDPHRGLLVRSEDAARAREVLEGAADRTGTDPRPD